MTHSEVDVFLQHESEARSYCRRFPTIFAKAKDSFLYDTQDNRYIDFFAGAGALNFGHNNERIKQAVLDYIGRDQIMMGLDMHTAVKERFIHTFHRLILQPRHLDYKMQFTSPSGTSVVESAIKLARKYTGRQNVIAFTNAFHGMTAGALSLTGQRSHRQRVSYGQVTRFPYANYMGEGLDTVAFIRRHLEDQGSGVDMPAAVILETVQGEGGINVAPVGWLQDLRALTREYGILLIVDDIQAGCGRTGKFFSFERAGIAPDMVCLSKSIGGIGLPMALLLLSPRLDVWDAGEDNGTFRGNNLAFAASVAMLEHYWQDNAFETEIRRKSHLVQAFVESVAIKHRHAVSGYRGLGLMFGLQFVNPDDAGDIAQWCFDHNVILETCGSSGQVLKLMPALTIDIEVLQEGLDIVGAVIDAYYAAEMSSHACSTFA